MTGVYDVGVEGRGRGRQLAAVDVNVRVALQLGCAVLNLSEPCVQLVESLFEPFFSFGAGAAAGGEAAKEDDDEDHRREEGGINGESGEEHLGDIGHSDSSLLEAITRAMSNRNREFGEQASKQTLVSKVYHAYR